MSSSMYIAVVKKTTIDAAKAAADQSLTAVEKRVIAETRAYKKNLLHKKFMLEQPGELVYQIAETKGMRLVVARREDAFMVLDDDIVLNRRCGRGAFSLSPEELATQQAQIDALRQDLLAPLQTALNSRLHNLMLASGPNRIAPEILVSHSPILRKVIHVLRTAVEYGSLAIRDVNLSRMKTIMGPLLPPPPPPRVPRPKRKGFGLFEDPDEESSDEEEDSRQAKRWKVDASTQTGEEELTRPRKVHRWRYIERRDIPLSAVALQPLNTADMDALYRTIPRTDIGSVDFYAMDAAVEQFGLELYEFVLRSILQVA